MYKKYFLLDIGKLKIGDVICTTNKKNITSTAIRVFTNSQYSHVLMVYGYSAFIHADNAGVYSYNIQRFIFTEKDSVRVLRLKEEYRDKIDAICEYLQYEVGKVYGTVSALNAWLKMDFFQKIEEPSSVQFCSKLIAECFQKSGLNIVEKPDTCFPKDIASSPLFEIITDILVPCDSKSLEFAKTESPQDIQAKIFTQILLDIKKEINPYINTLSKSISYILENPNYDLKMLEIFEKNEYTKVNDIELEKNGYRYGEYDDFVKFVSGVKMEELQSLQKTTEFLIPIREKEIDDLRKLQDLFFDKYNKNSDFYSYLIHFYCSLLRDQLIFRENIEKFKENINQE